MADGCKYTEYSVTGNQQGVVFQLGGSHYKRPPNWNDSLEGVLNFMMSFINPYFSQNIMRVIKEGEMGATCSTHGRENSGGKNLMEKDHLEDLCADGRTTIL
jgi:hypothetical protein